MEKIKYYIQKLNTSNIQIEFIIYSYKENYVAERLSKGID